MLAGWELRELEVTVEGEVDPGYPAAAAGHTIAIYSASHDHKKVYASEEAYFEDLYKMQSLIQEYTGQTATLMRFPGGSSNTVSCAWLFISCERQR